MDIFPKLIFSPEFFQAEMREDFEIDATMKTVWAAEMEMLADIDAVCQKYGLQYFAYWGTLLGTVRHHGFVPWDDDMDLAMKREDYNKLMEALPKELPSNYRVMWGLSEEGRDIFWGSVKNADTISVEPERLRKFHGCPFQVAIDIVPIDTVPREEGEALLLNRYMTLIRSGANLAKKENKTDTEKRDLSDILTFFEQKENVTFYDSKPIANQLWSLGNAMASAYGENDGDYLTMHTTNVGANNTFFFEKDWWEQADVLPFEEIFIPVPVGYDEVLKRLYGDYHVRIRGVSDHEYPFYQKQMRQLRDMVKRIEGKR